MFESGLHAGPYTRCPRLLFQVGRINPWFSVVRHLTSNIVASAAGTPPAFSLRSLSDPSKPHSFAAAAVLDTRGLVPDDGRSWAFSKTALVSDKFVLKADSHDLSVLMIWNWIYGTLLVVRIQVVLCVFPTSIQFLCFRQRKEMPLAPSFICGGVSLISNHSFILPIIALPYDLEFEAPTAYIEVYEFDDHGSPYTSMRDPTAPQHSQFASDASSTDPLPRLVRTFLLPEMNIPSPFDDRPLQLGFDFYCFSLFHNALSLAAEDIPSINPLKSGSAVLIGGLDRPTQPLDKDRLCHIILDAHLGEAEVNHCYDFFVYTSTFSKDPARSETLDAEWERYSPPRIPWEDWGVKNAAAFCSIGGTHEATDVDICWHARGDRVAVVGIDREWASKQDEDTLRMAQRNWQLRVLDFRPERVRRVERMVKATKGSASTLALWPRPPSVFKEDHGAVLPTIKCSSNDKYATPAGYSGEYFFKEWPVRAGLPYVETILDRTIQALWVDVEMDGEHLVTNCCEVRIFYSPPPFS